MFREATWMVHKLLPGRYTNSPPSGGESSDQMAKWEVGQIQVVTSRLLEIGSEPHKDRSAAFLFNITNLFGDINITKLLGLGLFPAQP